MPWLDPTVVVVVASNHIDPILMFGDSPFRLLKNPHLWKTLPIPSMGPKYSTGQVSISLQRIGRGVVGDGEVSQDEGCRRSKWGLGLYFV